MNIYLKEAAKFTATLVIIRLLALTYDFIKSRFLNRSAQRKIKDKYVLITGATDGIGKEIALCLSKKGHKLIIVGRSPEKLKHVEQLIIQNGSECKTFVFDFAEQLDFVGTFTEYDIALLINNVGCCSDGPQPFVNDPAMEDILNVNVVNTFRLTREVVKQMVAKRMGYVVNVGSITGDIPMPLLVCYSASKAMIKAWSRSLNAELKPFGINVECMNTGYVCTKMSRIRRSNLLCPSAEVYAQCVLKHFGSNYLSFAYYPHLLLSLWLSFLPSRAIGMFIYLFLAKKKSLKDAKLKKK